MQTLNASEKTAREAYEQAPDWFKPFLEESFGQGFFQKKKTAGDVKTLQDVFEVMDINQFSFYSANDTADERAYKEIKLVTKFLNDGWEPDWNDGDEYKWYLWFWLNDPGFRLDVVCYTHSYSNVGSRLCFKTEALARKAFEIIPESYRIYHTLNNQ